MSVRELIKQLEQYDQDLPIATWDAVADEATISEPVVVRDIVDGQMAILVF